MSQNAVDFEWLGRLFQTVFGGPADAFKPEVPTIYGNTKTYRSETGYHGANYYKQDALGNEYYLPVTITYPNNGVNQSIDLQYPIVSISCRRTLIETPLTERDGSAMEWINTGNYEINVKGFIINQDNELPENLLGELQTLWVQKVAVSMRCVLTDIFLKTLERGGSDMVVIRDMRLPEIKGVKNVRPYELIMQSDMPFNLVDIS